MTLFEGIAKDPTNADIGPWMNNRSQHYLIGYRSAAEKLCADYGDLPQIEKDSLVFPVIFLYRHHLELLLKDIIFRAETIQNVQPRYDTKKNHYLSNLWDEAKRLFKLLVPLVDIDLLFVTSAELESQNDAIKEFNKYDRYSAAFRFSTNNKGGKELADIKYISISNFQTEINRLLRYLDQVNETICHYESV